MEREKFLGRVAAALRGADLPASIGPDDVPEIRFEDPIAVFEQEAVAVSTEVTRARPGEALAAVARVFETAGESCFIAWEQLDGFLPGVEVSLEGLGFERIDAGVAADPEARKLDHARVGTVAIGITGADFAIAASGSVMLIHGPGRPRSASLLVEHHIVLLPAARIVDSLIEAMSGVTWKHTSNVAIITGPSRTGDIDSVLTLGVHGPRHLHVIVIE